VPSFDAVSHDWLVRFVEHRVGDRRVVRLIRNWLKADVRFAVKHPRGEPGAGIPPAGICAGGVRCARTYRDRRSRAMKGTEKA
jgi:hypothetical protein